MIHILASYHNTIKGLKMNVMSIFFSSIRHIYKDHRMNPLLYFENTIL